MRSLTPAEKTAWIESLDDDEALELAYCWEFWARPSQLPPEGDWWFVWLIMAGRGFGKTRTGAEWVRDMADYPIPGLRIALVGATSADVRDTMIEGESGLIACAHPNNRPTFIANRRRVDWPSGAVGFTYSAEKPARLRGPQHHAAWCDELAAWQYSETFKQLKLGLRLGKHPRICCTTTPQPKAIIRELIALVPGDHDTPEQRRRKTTALTHGTTYDNLANLSDPFKDQVLSAYEGTRLGEQELNARLLTDVPGALWKNDQFETLRELGTLPAMRSKIIGIDPAVSSRGKSKEARDEAEKKASKGGSCNTGIVVAGYGANDLYYVLGDHSQHDKPHIWALVAVRLYYQTGADMIVAEVNNGGDLVESVIRVAEETVRQRARDAGAPAPPPVRYLGVHASKGKQTRAEPIAGLYERNIVRHAGVFTDLEDEMSTWDPMGHAPSPDRLDAMVWAMTALYQLRHHRMAGVVDASPHKPSDIEDDY